MVKRQVDEESASGAIAYRSEVSIQASPRSLLDRSSVKEAVSPFSKIEEELSFLHVDNAKEKAFEKSVLLWTEKYCPRNPGELLVHAKKVAEVREWLKSQLGPVGFRSRVLLVTGPSGTGKKTVIRVLAESMGFELFEWTAPAPVLWKEHLHHNSTGSTYSSKVDDFEAFSENARKYPSLPLGSAERTRLVLIDDLPFVGADEKKEQLSQSLYRLIVGAQFPTVIVLTDSSEDNGQGVVEDVLHMIERAGAPKIAFNPITTNATKKMLAKILEAEGCELPSDTVAEIAETAAGDIRSALLSLQFMCTGRHQPIRNTHKKRRKASFAKRQKLFASAEESSTMKNREPRHGRDETLSLFHALGKFLHNKRCTDQVPDSGERVGCPLQTRYIRHPLKMAEPETIIAQAHADSTTISCFCHENAIDFLNEEGVEDAAEIMGYLSDADFLACRFSWQRRKPGQSAGLDVGWSTSLELAQSVAASVAARGVLFGNTHPAPRKWQTLRSPVLWQVERALASKQVGPVLWTSKEPTPVGKMLGAVNVVQEERSAWATECLPFLRCIASRRQVTVPDTAPSGDEDEIEDD